MAPSTETKQSQNLEQNDFYPTPMPGYIRDYNEKTGEERFFDKFRWVSLIAIGSFFALASFTSNTEVKSSSLIPMEGSVGLDFEIPFLSTNKSDGGEIAIKDVSKLKAGVFLVLKSTSQIDEAFKIMSNCAEQGVITTYFHDKVDGEEQYHVILSRGFSSKEDALGHKYLLPQSYRAKAWVALLDSSNEIKS